MSKIADRHKNSRSSILTTTSSASSRSKNGLHTTLTFAGVILGVTLGLVLKATRPLCYWTPRNVMYVKFPGEILTNILSCLKVPLCCTSIVAAIGSLDLKLFRSIGLRALAYSCIGMILAAGIASGVIVSMSSAFKRDTRGYVNNSGVLCKKLSCSFWDLDIGDCGADRMRNHSGNILEEECELEVDVFMDFARAAASRNIIESSLVVEKTKPDLSRPDNPNETNYTAFSSCKDYIQSLDGPPKKAKALKKFGIRHESIEGVNLVNVFMISVFIGMCVLWQGDSASNFLNIWISLSEVHLQMATWALWMSPIGIVSLVAGSILESKDLFHVSSSLSVFTCAVIFCQLLHIFLTQPLIYIWFLRKAPFKFFRTLLNIMTTAFGTSSSMGTLPITIKGLEEITNLDPRLVRLVAPIGTILNQSGSVTFIASSVTYCIVKETGSISWSSFGSVLLVTPLVAVATYTGLPVSGPEKITIVLGLLGYNIFWANDIKRIVWIIDRFVTVTNVVGDCFCAAIVDHYLQKQLQEMMITKT